MKFEIEYYGVVNNHGHLLRTGKAYTPAIYDNLASAKRLVTRKKMYNVKIVKLTEYTIYEEVEI